MLRRAVHRLRFVGDHSWVPAHASEYLDGDLRPPELARVQRHVDQCAECRELLRSLQVIVGALGTMRDVQGELVAGAVLASVKSRLGDLPPTGR